MPWVLDLDGVVWLGDEPIAGSAKAIETLRAKGERVLFLTNNSSQTVNTYVEKMARMGFACSAEDLCSSAQAAALLVNPGETALVIGGKGIEEALLAGGSIPVHDQTEGVDAVIVGWHRDFNYDRLTLAFRAIRNGARLIGTNDDPTYPSSEGELPGGGSIVAAVSYATGVVPTFAGKPNWPAAQLVYERLGWGAEPTAAQRATLWMVGDRPSTDGGMARRLGGRFGLVLSGVTARADLPVDPEPYAVAEDLAELVKRFKS
jgi:glycerol-1-phosphatase